MSAWGRIRASLNRIAGGELLTFASAISFQTCHAMIPVTLAALALLGFLDIQSVWYEEIAPQIQRQVSPDLYGVINSTVEQLIQTQRGFWLTFGLAFAVWQVSGAVRATMGALNHIYGVEEQRSLRARLGVSLLLSLAVGVCVIAAIAAAELLPRALEAVGWAAAPRIVLRWLLPILALYAVMFVLLHFGPAQRGQIDTRWTTALLVIGGWLIVSFVFRWYAVNVADYTSVFGNLASVFVLITYVYLSVAVFLIGVRVDALVRGIDVGEPS